MKTIEEVAIFVQEWVEKHEQVYNTAPSLKALENILNMAYERILNTKQKDAEEELKAKYKKSNEEALKRAYEAETALEGIKERQKELIVEFLKDNDIYISELLTAYLSY